MSLKKTVKDVMVGIFEYPHIPYWFSVNQAIRIAKVSFLQGKKYLEPTVLIFDEKYSFMGTITFRDILKGIEPRIMQQSSADQTEEQRDRGSTVDCDALFGKESRELMEKPISDILVPAKFFVEPGDSLSKAALLMIQHDLILLPVLEGKKKFVGLVRMSEVFDEVSGSLLDAQNE